MSLVPTLCDFVTLLCHFGFFSVNRYVPFFACIAFVLWIFNVCYGKIPLFPLTGITPDISIILLFTFYQPVFYATYDQNFPSVSEERAGYLVGFGEHCGDVMNHKILDHDTQKIIDRSAVRPKKSSTPNHRLAPRFCIF